MKRKQLILSIIALILVASMLFPFAACAKIDVVSVDLDRSSLRLDIGEAVTLNAMILPENATIQTVDWRSSDTSVATVDKEGKVTGVGEGSAIVRASVDGKSATCSVTVYDSSKLAVEVTGLTLDADTLRLTAENRVATLTATITPSNATDKTVNWTSSDEKVAKVQNGVVTALSQGAATVTAMATNGIYATCSVFVTGDFSEVDDGSVHVTSVSVEPTSLTLIVGRTGQLSATVLPEDATNKSVSWDSDNKSVATVSDGVVTAVAPGTATIIVTTVDGNKTAECAVTVRERTSDDVDVTGVTLNKNTLSLLATRSETLVATVQPSNATDKNVSWKSDDVSVATVDATGKVTAVAAGTANITVTTSDGGFTASCAVTVSYAAATVVSLSQTTLKLNSKGLTAKLTATVNPKTANPAVNWTTSDASVATVDDGVVTALNYGTATITATTLDGTKSASCTVTVEFSSDELYVKKVESLSTRTTDFIMGMDASAVPSIEAARKANNEPLYKNFAGVEEDVFKILKDNGITDIRIRVWNDPTDGNGHSYGGGNCDIDNAVEISRRCAAVGLGVIIDFHYSDFWADPGKYTIPKAWKGLSTDQVANKIYDFTKESLEKVKATGVKITMVQVGNETNRGMAGSTDWAVISQYMNKGSKAVRDVTGTVANGGAKVAVHFTNPEVGNFNERASTLSANNVDYDVFGTSYYPFWHGTLSNLAKQLSTVHNNYGKEVMVLETSYAFTNEEFDGVGNTRIDETPYVISVQGQANSVLAVIDTVATLGDWGLGVCYWEGTWISASTEKNAAKNVSLCLQYGCGWASEYAHSYDNSAPTEGGGGCVIDNQAFFMPDGTPIESLKVFGLAKKGNPIPLKADEYDKLEVSYTVNSGVITLPSKVSGTLTDGSHVEMDVTWNVTAAELAQYLQTKGKYTIMGTTQYGKLCELTLWILNPNLASAGSFESDEGVTGYGSKDNFIQSNSELGGWQTSHVGGTALQLYTSNDSGNARMGSQSFHFWDSSALNFKLYQTIDLSKLTEYGAGKYTLNFDIMGGDGVDMDIHAYVKITYNDGTAALTKDGNSVELKGWLEWQTTTVSVDIADLSKVASIEIGISVVCGVTGGGPWGNIDNCQFYFED